MGETIKGVLDDLTEAANTTGNVIYLKEEPLSFDAANVRQKLSVAKAADGYHRVYEKSPEEMSLVDVLTDRDIESRGYRLADDDPIKAKGNSPLGRDVLRCYTTKNPLYEDVWIGERLE